jgi:hypothetical protein
MSRLILAIARVIASRRPSISPEARLQKCEFRRFPGARGQVSAATIPAFSSLACPFGFLMVGIGKIVRFPDKMVQRYAALRFSAFFSGFREWFARFSSTDF